MQAEYFALEGVSELLDTIERLRQSFNPDLEIEGVVLTMYDDRTNLAQQVTQELKRHFGDKPRETIIPRNIRLAEAPSYGKPALFYDVRSRGAESYIRLAKEMMHRRMHPVSRNPRDSNFRTSSNYGHYRSSRRLLQWQPTEASKRIMINDKRKALDAD